jgi:hypothetical protein
MKVLIACEESQVVCKAFRARGHEAYSCDLQECSGGHPEWHKRGDFRNVNQESWDFVGYHYECRVMANSGVRWLYEIPGRWEELDEACEMFNLTLSDTRPGYSENPIQHCYAREKILMPYTQIVQPWYHDEPYFKATCLWLRSLTILKDTNRLVPPLKGTDEYKAWSKIWREPPGKDRSKIRSKTFPGIANAMAFQWG